MEEKFVVIDRIRTNEDSPTITDIDLLTGGKICREFQVKKDSKGRTVYEDIYESHKSRDISKH